MLKVDHGSQDFFSFLPSGDPSEEQQQPLQPLVPPLAAAARVALGACARARPASRPPAAATALDGPGWSGGRPSLRPSQACKARAARAYQQYIPRLGACHGTKAGSRGLGHAGLNGLCGLQCLCAAAAAADHTLHSSGIIVQLVRPSFWNPGI